MTRLVFAIVATTLVPPVFITTKSLFGFRCMLENQ